MNCSIARALDVVGEWWTLLIVRDIGLNDVHRFDALQRELGIARNVLAARLSKLIDHGIVTTRLYHERPPRSEYHLTEKGQELASVLFALMEWGNRHTRGSVEVGPPLRLEHVECGSHLTAATACPTCNVLVDGDDRRLVHSKAE